jgi:hypothetical protein
MPLPLVLSAPGGQVHVLVAAAAFCIAPPSPAMYISLPKHNRTLYPGTDSLVAPLDSVLLLVDRVSTGSSIRDVAFTRFFGTAIY